MIKLTIDGKTVEAPEGATILRAAKQAGIEIPTLCDHPKLEPYGGCRLCVVELEGARAPVTACTMPVSNGMVVRTDTAKLHEIRKFVLMLLFSERNHYCMYCQKSGGDCELQNAAYGEAMTHWPIQPAWNTFAVDSSHPFFVVDHNRCILCRRCVRACGELVGHFTLGMHERGAQTMLVADYDVPLGESSCLECNCGNCVQACPTGAFIDRTSAYHGLDKAVEHVKSTCVQCSVGCGIEMVVHDNQLLRIDGDWDAPVNDGLLCEQGRYTPMYDRRERLVTPLVKKNGALKAATWDEALDVLAAKLGPLAGQRGSVAAAASARLPAEALHLFKQLFAEGVKSRQVTSLEAAALPSGVVEAKVDVLKEADCVLSVGVDLTKDHRVAGFFVKRALPQGLQWITLDAVDGAHHHFAQHALKVKSGTEAAVLHALMQASGKPAPHDLAAYTPEAVAAKAGVTAEKITLAAQALAVAQSPVLVYGKGLPAETLTAVAGLAKLLGAKVVGVKGQANSLAAAAYGLDQALEVKGSQAVFVALGDEAPSQKLVQALEQAPFLAVQASYVSPLTARADVVLPVEMWAEQAGHYVSLDGRVQAAQRGVTPAEDVRSSAAVLQQLGEKLGLKLNGNWKAELKQRTLSVTIDA